MEMSSVRRLAHRALPQTGHDHALASQRDGVCADPIDVSNAPIAGSNPMVLNKSFAAHSLMAFWPAASWLLDGRKPAAAVVAPLPSLAPERTAAQCVDAQASQALLHQAVQHPYLLDLASGEQPETRWAMQDSARQDYAYSVHIPRYLIAGISRLENPAHRLALLANLTEESGQYEQEELDELAAIGIESEWIVGLPHPELFRRFRRALGVLDDDDRPEAVGSGQGDAEGPGLAVLLLLAERQPPGCGFPGAPPALRGSAGPGSAPPACSPCGWRGQGSAAPLAGWDLGAGKPWERYMAKPDTADWNS